MEILGYLFLIIIGIILAPLVKIIIIVTVGITWGAFEQMYNYIFKK